MLSDVGFYRTVYSAAQGALFLLSCDHFKATKKANKQSQTKAAKRKLIVKNITVEPHIILLAFRVCFSGICKIKFGRYLSSWF